jgi:hypothetical protein
VTQRLARAACLRPATRKPRGYAQAMPNEGDISYEETTDPLVADARNFYKVEK